MSETGSTARELILVVDDDRAGRYFKAHVLRRAGYAVREADNGQEALTVIAEEVPALLIADVKLPDMNGMDLCRQVKAAHPSIMALQTSAAFTDAEHRAKGLSGGADSYLVEPLTPEELLATVEALLRRYRAGAGLAEELVQRDQRLAQVNEQLRTEQGYRVEVEDLLRHAQKLDVLGQLTGGIAHDFNNILTIVTGNLESLKRQLAQAAPDLERIRIHTDRAFYGAQRAVAVTRQLLAFSRRQKLEPKIIDLNVALSQLTSVLQQVTGDRVQLEISGAGDLWPVRVDPDQFETAVLNLALNARDAMPRGGTLKLEVENLTLCEGADEIDYVLLRVADTGAGMSDAVRKMAFEPFFTTKDVGHGTGLGLSQVHGFITQTGGRVDVDSVPGAGTEIRLLLPRYTGPLLPESNADVEPQSDVARGIGACVLVVEDDDDVATHALNVFRDLGYATVHARSGDQALSILNSNKQIDLLFTDIGLPGGMSGADLGRQVKESSPRLPIIYVSGYDDARLQQEGMGQNTQIVAKPYTFEVLARAATIALRASPRQGSILVVEDEPLIRMDLAHSLGELGFRVREAGSSAEALDVLAEEGSEIAALVTDIGLPDGRGDDLADRVRAERATMPVIVTTGYTQLMGSRLKRDSLTDFLPKPYHPQQIADALRRMGIE